MKSKIPYKSLVSPMISLVDSGALNCSNKFPSVSLETEVKGTLTIPSPSSLYMATIGDPMFFSHWMLPDLRSSVTRVPAELSVKWARSAKIWKAMCTTND